MPDGADHGGAVRITEERRRRTQERIRAAMDRLLNGDNPTDGGCDVKTLAAEAGVTRNSLYTTYAHLKDEFETRRERLHDAGAIVDSRQAQIVRLKGEVTRLRERAADRDARIATLTEQRTIAISRLVAQHDEILRLRHRLARHGNVYALHPAPDAEPM
jgi:chromosome segregation ATPase